MHASFAQFTSNSTRIKIVVVPVIVTVSLLLTQSQKLLQLYHYYCYQFQREMNEAVSQRLPSKLYYCGRHQCTIHNLVLTRSEQSKSKGQDHQLGKCKRKMLQVVRYTYSQRPFLLPPSSDIYYLHKKRNMYTQNHYKKATRENKNFI